MSNPKRKPVAQAEALAGVDVNNSVKIELIRKFQRVEGNVDCCASPYTRVCKQIECLWRDECLALTQG